MDFQKSCLNARRDISAALYGGAFHESEPSSTRTLCKIAAVLYQLIYEDPYISSKPMFLVLVLTREGNEIRNGDNVNCRNTIYDRRGSNTFSKLSNCKLA